MDISSIFKDSSNVINSIKQVISYDKELSNLLVASGGIISIIGFSFEMYKRIKDKMKTNEEKALLSLIHISLKITEKILKDINNKKEFNAIISKKEIDKKELINELLNSFANKENWDSYLTQHPAITEFKSKIKYILSNNIGLYNKTINSYFIIKFDIYLVEECKKNEDIKNILELRLIDERYENIIKFLEYLSNQNNIISPYNNKLLSDYFIQQDSVITNYSTWEKDEEEFRNSHKQEIFKVIDDFLNNNNEVLLVIGAIYGIGKTSLSKMIATKYSNQLMEIDESILKNLNYSNYGKYFPIIIYLGNGLKSEFNDWSLEYLFNKIIVNDNESKKRNILLVFDALDEYPDDINNFFDEVQKYLNDYNKLKIILTTRLLHGLDEKLSKISKQKYIRLLSFTPDKVNKLFESYTNEEQKLDLKKKYDIDKLTFEYITNDIGITNDKTFEITNPLFAWMLILLYSSPYFKIEFKEGWSLKFRKSLIYMFFVHYIIRGKFQSTETFYINKTYYFEKKSLRIIAKLKQFKKNELFWSDCEKEIKSYVGSNVDIPMLEKTLSSILHTYIFSPFQTTTRRVNFIHKTFMEYLVAEYYIESVLKGKDVYLNIGNPSNVTIEFLEGLIEILNSDDEDTKKKFINYNENIQITFFNSLDYKKDHIEAKRDMIDTCVNCIKNKNIVFLSDNVKIEEKDGYCKYILNVERYSDLWVHQWIALRILLLLNHDLIHELREKIISILNDSMIISSDLIKGIDLSSLDLSKANLEGANLEGVNLSKANLEGTNLNRSNLRDANMTNSRLYSTQFSYANLSNAKISGANGLEVKLNNADLTNTDFSNFNSNFPKEDHKRYHINFIFDLCNTNLSYANFSNVDLGSSMIINLRSYTGLVINEATNFSYSIIDELSLIDYIQKYTKKIPKKIGNKKELQKMLRGVGYSSNGAEPFLDISKLPEE